MDQIVVVIIVIVVVVVVIVVVVTVVMFAFLAVRTDAQRTILVDRQRVVGYLYFSKSRDDDVRRRQ